MNDPATILNRIPRKQVTQNNPIKEKIIPNPHHLPLYQKNKEIFVKPSNPVFKNQDFELISSSEKIREVIDAVLAAIAAITNSLKNYVRWP
jgi:hypothetical protein